MVNPFQLVSFLLLSLLLSIPAIGAEPKRNWVLVEKDVLSALEDLYVDISFRQQVAKDAYMISTLIDKRGKQRAVEIFGDDGTGDIKSVLLNDKKYRSVIHLDVFSCKEKKRGSYLTLYQSEPMGTGKTIYRLDDAEDRGSRGDFIPMMSLMHLPGEAALRRFACTGRL